MSFLKFLKYKFVWIGIALTALFLVQTYAFPSAYDLAARKRKAHPDEKVYFSSKKLFHDIEIDASGDILVGNVRITHDGMLLTCDSAVIYEHTNTFLAYGRVYMTDGDSVTITGDSLYYDGTKEFAQIFAHEGKDVVFKHGKMTLKTEILNYNRLENLGFFDTGGIIIDGKTVLTSQHGKYQTDTKDAYFFNSPNEPDVVLVNNNKDKLVTRDLHYNTQTKWAHVKGMSNVFSGNNRIDTEDAYYNTETGLARMIDRNKLSNYKHHSVLVADSIHYDKQTKRSYAFRNVIYTDSANNNILMGDYGWYDEDKGEAMCTENALAKDYTNVDDTLFIHGDTLRLYSYNQKTDSAYRVLRGYYHVRAFRNDMQMVCDSLNFISKDSCLTLYKDPIAWNDTRQIVGEEIQVFLNDSTIDSVYVNRQAMMIEQLNDSTLYNQVAGHLMRTFFKNGELKEFWVDGNGIVINYPMEKDSTYLYLNYVEAAKLRAYMENKRMHKMLGFPSPKGTTYPLGMAPPERTKLEGFAWFDWIRPMDKYDIFEWRSKGDKNKLKEMPRRSVPLQTLQRVSNKMDKKEENKLDQESSKTTKPDEEE